MLEDRNIASPSPTWSTLDNSIVSRCGNRSFRETQRYGVRIIGTELIGWLLLRYFDRLCTGYWFRRLFDHSKQVLEKSLVGLERSSMKLSWLKYYGVCQGSLDAPSSGGGSAALYLLTKVSHKNECLWGDHWKKKYAEFENHQGVHEKRSTQASTKKPSTPRIQKPSARRISCLWSSKKRNGRAARREAALRSMRQYLLSMMELIVEALETTKSCWPESTLYGASDLG